MKETELAEPVISWLSEQKWNVYQEVEFKGHSGIADIVAERHGIIWIIETKTAMTLDVLYQACRWPVHFRSVAVPSPKRSYERHYDVAKYYYQVGVIEVDRSEIYNDGWFVKEKISPKFFMNNHRVARNMSSQLTDLHKTFSKAGSKGGSHLTPYKLTMLEIRSAITNNPGCTIQDLFDICGKMHYANKQSFKGNVLKCLLSFEKDWCKVDTSVVPHRLYLTDAANKNQRMEVELRSFYKKQEIA